jgi:hypothetical protein
MSETVSCPACHGSGACARCGGSGGGDSAGSQCPDCKGTGDCPRCEGEGVLSAEPEQGA